MTIPKRFKYFIFLLIIIFIGLIIHGNYKSKSNKKKLDKIGLRLTGVITEVDELTYGHDWGFVGIDISSSNFTEYDPRKENQDYAFVIENKRCALLLPAISEIGVGDSIVVNSSKFSIFRAEKIIKSKSNLGLLSSHLLDNPNNLLQNKN